MSRATIPGNSGITLYVYLPATAKLYDIMESAHFAHTFTLTACEHMVATAHRQLLVARTAYLSFEESCTEVLLLTERTIVSIGHDPNNEQWLHYLRHAYFSAYVQMFDEKKMRPTTQALATNTK